MTETLRDEQLFARYAGGADRDAFEELFRRYAPRLERYFARTAGPEQASDLLQLTLLHVHRARRDFRVEARFRPWLFAIAANVRREYWRRRARRPESPLDDAGPEAATDTSVPPDASTAEQRLVRRCVQALPEGQREIVVLHWYEELPFSEIASIVGASLSAVKVRAHRAYRALRECLGELG